jgi:hypothetical protein
MLRALLGFLCLSFAISTQAKLGESVPQLIKRFGKSYTIESDAAGEKYRFRSEKVSVDVLVSNGVSVAETYFSDHPLDANGEPPNDIVRAVLKTNVPQVRWLETDAAPFVADYALRSSDQQYIALLRYRGPQPEGATWTMTVARRENIPVAVAALPTTAAPSKSPVANVNESPTQAASIAVASTPAVSSNAAETTTAPLESAPAATPPPQAQAASPQPVPGRGIGSFFVLLVLIFILYLVFSRRKDIPTRLIRCPDCGTEVSTKAASCPKCGRVFSSARPQQTGGCTWIIIIALGIVLGVVLISVG